MINAASLKKNRGNTEYDFVVVGGGSSGNALAARLSEDKKAKVLVLEHGPSDLNWLKDPENTLNALVPAACGKLQGVSVDTKYRGEAGPAHSIGLINKLPRLPRGRVLGGCSTINYMAAVRASHHDYNEWAYMTNDTDWSFDRVLPLFKKMEGRQLNTTDFVKKQFEKDYHGFNGPLTTSVLNHPKEISKRFLQAAVDIGFEEKDYNGKDINNAVGFSQQTIRNGARENTAQAYIHPSLSRANLDVSVNSCVSKVLIDESSKTAYGVEVLANPDDPKSGFVVKAKKEVIVCAGAYNSPQLLMLSGIGPKEELEKHGIKTIVDSPQVGKNLQDHLFSLLRFNIKNDTPIDTEVVNVKNAEGFPLGTKALVEWLTYGTGRLASPAYDVLGFGTSKFSKPTIYNDSHKHVDIQIGLFASGANSDLWQGNLGYDNLPGFFKDEEIASHNKGFLAVSHLLKPQSKGYVALRSNNPLDSPIIQHNYLAEENDVKTLVDINLRFMKMVKQKSLAEVTDPLPILPKKLVDEFGGGSKEKAVESYAFWEQYVKHYATTVYHPTSTCAMGTNIDNSVVNGDLQVHEINNLRVCDASVMPNVPSGNTNLPAILIGEVLAEKMKRQYNLSQDYQTGRNVNGAPLLDDSMQPTSKKLLLGATGIAAAAAFASVFSKSNL